MAKPLRIFIYAQHLSGVGHYVRSLEIARALVNAKHTVQLIDAGKPVPRNPVEGLVRIELPRIFRANENLSPLAVAARLDGVMAARRQRLHEAVATLKPDVVVIEHYPFSKWELGEEIRSLTNAARSVNRRIRIVCSVRDIPRQTKHEECSPEIYGQTVLARLHADFDAVMVHGEESLTHLKEHFPQAEKIQLPLVHTGIVSEKISRAPNLEQRIEQATGGRPYLLASVGGGTDRAGLLPLCLKAWRQLKDRGNLQDWMLALFSGLDGAASELINDTADPDPSILLRPFSDDYLAWMSQARLAITCAGYNTCANLLEIRCRALLLPNPAMSDQLFRARLMAEQGLAELSNPECLAPETLAQTILRCLNAPRPEHVIPLDGAERAATFIQTLVPG